MVAYQTGYLKAHYPAEYMAAVLTNNMGDIKKVTFFIEEARKQGVPVLGPDVNESILKFNVNEEGQIRFGLAAVKGAGEAAVEEHRAGARKKRPLQGYFRLCEAREPAGREQENLRKHGPGRRLRLV